MLTQPGFDHAELEQLSRKKQLAFGLFILDRIYPLLQIFSKRTGFDYRPFVTARIALWNSLTNDSEKQKTDWSVREVCLQTIPDTEDYSDEFVSHALSYTLSVVQLIDFAQQGNPDNIREVVRLAQDSISLYVSSLDPQTVSRPNLSRLFDHYLMKEESARQRTDIQFLADLPEQFDNDTVSTLLRHSEGQVPILPVK
jgi:uncharacterized protein YjaG (DUF416 family)